MAAGRRMREGKRGMAQIFTASADTRLRAMLLMAAAALVLAIVAGYASQGYGTVVGWVRDQPVPFRHRHHAGDLGIDCRYCHGAVETSSRAGFPATHVCMTCHSQIWTNAGMLAPVRLSLAQDKPLIWQRVSKLPDYVYFNHSAHVAKGVPCVTCHGRIDRMPLTAAAHSFHMNWCLDCHRNPGPALRPPGEVTRMDWSGWDDSVESHRQYAALRVRVEHIDPVKLTQCNVCHR